MGSSNMMDGFGMMGFWGFGPLVMILIFGLVIAGIIWIVKSTLAPSSNTRTSPLEILEERFARGEIDESEFHIRRQQLMS